MFRTCRECGCTDARACLEDGMPCGWAEADLCTACAKETPPPKILTDIRIESISIHKDGMFPITKIVRSSDGKTLYEKETPT